MTAYSNAIDEAYEELSAKLGRELHSDEVEELEGRLLQSWVSAGRFKELVEYAEDEFEFQDGEAFCASLGNALCTTGEVALAKNLFQTLAQAREAAFWRVWPKAQLGHIGLMKQAAVHLANTMKALSELYRCYAAVGDDLGQNRVKDEMLRLQERRKSEA